MPLFLLQCGEYKAPFMLECPLYKVIRDKFLSIFKNVVLGSLKSFAESAHQVDISLYLMEDTILHHSKEWTCLKLSSCTFSPISFFGFPDSKINFIISHSLTLDHLQIYKVEKQLFSFFLFLLCVFTFWMDVSLWGNGRLWHKLDGNLTHDRMWCTCCALLWIWTHLKTWFNLTPNRHQTLNKIRMIQLGWSNHKPTKGRLLREPLTWMSQTLT